MILICTLTLAPQVSTGNAAINDIPRQDLILAEYAVSVKSGVNTCTVEDIHPTVVIKVLIPRVEHNALFAGKRQRGRNTAITTRKDCLYARHARIVIVILHTAVGNLTKQIFLLFLKLFKGILRLPLEGGKGLGNKAGYADGNVNALCAIALRVLEVPGDVVTLTVARLGEMGAFLDAGTGNTSDDILLHKLQQTEEIKEGDKVKVYLYLDPNKRLTASMKLPKMREGQLGYVKVISVTRDGGFVDIGAERGVFLPYSQMRGHVSPNQLVWVKLYRDKSGRPAVTMRVEEDMQKASKPAEGLKVGDNVTGTVYNILQEGFFIFTTQRFIAFIHRSEVPGGRLDFGQEVTCRVTYLREDGRINCSMRLQKENALVADAEEIYSFLEKRGGKMPYSDSTPLEIIKQKFGISKAAFKRALGHLMKQGKIRQEDGWTYIIESPEQK